MSNRTFAITEFAAVGLILIAPLLTACGTPSTPPGIKKVECNDANNTSFCWKESFCAANAKDICSVGLHGDFDHTGLFPNAEFNGACDRETPEFSIPPCVCDYPSEDDSVCDGDSVGEPPEDPTGGGSADQYICTIFSQTKCVEYNYEEDPLLENYNYCWVDPNYPDTYQPCVWAVDTTDARNQCEDLCDKAKTDAEMDIATFNANNPTELLEVVGSPIDCVLDDSPSGDEPAVLAYPYECAPPQQALVAWGGVTVLEPFSSMAGLILSSGGSTSTTTIIGYIGYDVSSCGGGTCNVTIDAFEVRATDLAGTVFGVAGPIASYTVDGYDMHLTQIAQGTLTQSTGVITFAEPFVGLLTAEDYSINSTPIGPWETMQYVTQITGSLNPANDVLTLNYTYNLRGGVFTLRMERF